jgi:hypothetical protein
MNLTSPRYGIDIVIIPTCATVESDQADLVTTHLLPGDMSMQAHTVASVALMIAFYGSLADAQERSDSEKPATEPATLVGHCDPLTYYTYVLADGGLSTTGKDKNSVPASGSIGFRHLARNEEFRASIGLKSVTDTLHGTDTHDFATSLLAPANVGGTGSVDLSYRRFRCAIRTGAEQGIKIRLGALRTTWAFDSTVGTTQLTLSSPVTIINAAILWSAVWINQRDSSGNLLAFGTDLGPIARFYSGERTDDVFTTSTLGTTARRFLGASIVAWTRFHNVTVSGEFPYLHAMAGKQPVWARAAGPIVTFNLEAPLYTISNKVKER